MSDLNFSNLNLTVVGLGLIGGSIAKAINKRLQVKNLWAVDIDINVLKKAEHEGIIDCGFTNPSFPLENSDVVILCMYPKASIEFIKKNMESFRHNAVITDTAGIKSKIADEIKSIIRHDVEFIGGHPMSGKENSGYQFSDENICNDANYILTPHENNSESAVNMLKDIIRGMGFKNIKVMSPEEHDEAIAFTSQLVHIIACAIMNSSKVENICSCAGGSFRDATRVADINSDLWCELIQENKTNILHELYSFINDMNNIYDIINNDETENLKSMFIKSGRRRKEMNR